MRTKNRIYSYSKKSIKVLNKNRKILGEYLKDTYKV